MIHFSFLIDQTVTYNSRWRPQQYGTNIACYKKFGLLEKKKNLLKMYHCLVDLVTLQMSQTFLSEVQDSAIIDSMWNRFDEKAQWCLIKCSLHMADQSHPSILTPLCMSLMTVLHAETSSGVCFLSRLFSPAVYNGVESWTCCVCSSFLTDFAYLWEKIDADEDAWNLN